MRPVWKLTCLLGLIALAAIMAFVQAVLSQAPPQEAMRPILSICAALAVGGAVRSVCAIFARSYTAGFA
ncbi:MAG: hypothetical protein LBC57_04245 [Treponema sp.]|jgi:hypothetical protein|nr:hypothetical protein [Treponema sp.]